MTEFEAARALDALPRDVKLQEQADEILIDFFRDARLAHIGLAYTNWVIRRRQAELSVERYSEDDLAEQFERENHHLFPGGGGSSRHSADAKDNPPPPGFV